MYHNYEIHTSTNVIMKYTPVQWCGFFEDLLKPCLSILFAKASNYKIRNRFMLGLRVIINCRGVKNLK